MKKLLVAVLAVVVSACVGVRHGNPMKGDFAAVTSDVAAIETPGPTPESDPEPDEYYY